MSALTTASSIHNLNATMSILVANDGNNVWSYVGSVLEDCGYKVSKTTNGRIGLETIAQDRPDLIVVAEELSDINGLEWISQIRRQDPRARLAFVADYWRDAEFYQRLKNEFSVSLVMHRPFKPSLLILQVESLFGRLEAAGNNEALEHEGFERHESLKLRYVRILPLRVQELTSAWSRALGVTPDEREFQEAMRLAHNMKSSARYCGLRQVGESAEQVEKSIANMINGGSASLAIKNVESYLKLLALQVENVNSKFAESAKNCPDLPEETNRSNVLMVSTQIVVESLERNLKLLKAESYEAAMKIAQHHPIEAALIDMSVQSRHSALQFADSLRELSGNENLPLGFFSTGKCGDDQVEATRAGGSIFLEREADANAICNAAKYLANIRQGGRPRVLIIDDDPDFCQIIISTLGMNGMLVRVLNEPTKLINTLQEFSPDLVLLDVMMPMVNGLDVCRQLRSMARWQDIPIILLTAHTGAGARINAFEAGADDYLPKPIIELELLSRIRFRLERARLLKERADKDLLTGLLSRRAFSHQIEALISESSRHQFNFSIGFIDIDKFKQINDEHGHLVGDEVLKYLGELLSRRFRVEDLRARWGGEEFALPFPHATSCVMQAAMARVLSEFRNKQFESEHAQPFHVTFSAGMVTFPNEGRTSKELLQRADERLYQAKAMGRNTIVVSD